MRPFPFPGSRRLFSRRRVPAQTTDLARQSGEAFGALERFAERRPGDGWVLYYTGRVAGVSGEQMERGEQALTREHYRTALKINPYSPGATRALEDLRQLTPG